MKTQTEDSMFKSPTLLERNLVSSYTTKLPDIPQTKNQKLIKISTRMTREKNIRGKEGDNSDYRGESYQKNNSSYKKSIQNSSLMSKSVDRDPNSTFFLQKDGEEFNLNKIHFNSENDKKVFRKIVNPNINYSKGGVR
jgi:hypothetical protein